MHFLAISITSLDSPWLLPLSHAFAPCQLACDRIQSLWQNMVLYFRWLLRIHNLYKTFPQLRSIFELLVLKIHMIQKAEQITANGCQRLAAIAGTEMKQTPWTNQIRSPLEKTGHSRQVQLWMKNDVFSATAWWYLNTNCSERKVFP